MKKLLLILLCLPILIFAQDKKIVFYGDGTPYEGTELTINQLNDKFEKYGRVYSFNPEIEGFYTVGFKLFTNEILYVATEDITKLDSAVSKFNLNDFFNSYVFEMYLETYIEEGTLYDLFIIETLGPPNEKSKYYDQEIEIKTWIYLDLGVSLTFIDGILKSYIKTD